MRAEEPDPGQPRGPRAALGRDLGYAFAGQAAVLGISVVRTFLIPFLLGTDLLTYAEWQTYLLYLGYISLSFLGFNDGLYVRHAQRSGHTIRESMSSALTVYGFVLVGEALLLCGLALSLPISDQDTVVWVAVLANVPLAGIYGALIYHLQLSDKIDKASVVVATEKALFLALVLVAYFADDLSFVTLLGADIAAKTLALTYILTSERRSILANRPRLRLGAREFRLNVRVGLKIMLGAYCALLLSGATRIAAQLFQTDVTFAFFAFAFSVTGIVLLAGQAAAVVIYPRMARLGREGLTALLPALNRVAHTTFPVILLLYFPLAALVDVGLPQYSPSKEFLAFLLAVGALQLIVSTVNNSYYRLLRLENRMLSDNAVTLLLFIPVCLVLREHMLIMLGAQLLMLVVRIWSTQRLFRKRLEMTHALMHLPLLAWSAVFLGIVKIGSPWAAAAFAVVVGLHLLLQRRALGPVAELLTSRD